MLPIGVLTVHARTRGIAGAMVRRIPVAVTLRGNVKRAHRVRDALRRRRFTIPTRGRGYDAVGLFAVLRRVVEDEQVDRTAWHGPPTPAA